MTDPFVLVTGSSTGIGKACAEALREQGALVAMVDIAEEVLQFASPDAFPVVCDVNDSKAVDAAVRAVEDLASHATDLGARGPDPVYGYGLVGGDLGPTPRLVGLRAQ